MVDTRRSRKPPAPVIIHRDVEMLDSYIPPGSKSTRSFRVCNRLLKVSGGQFTAVGRSVSGRRAMPVNSVGKSSSVFGLELHSLEAVAGRRMMDTMNNRP